MLEIKMNKRNLIKKNNILIFMIFSLGAFIFLIWTSEQVSAAKADQFYYENYTCENFIDIVDSTNMPVGGSYTQIGNKTESPVSAWTGIRYASYNDAPVNDTALGPRWECAAITSPNNTCSVLEKGFNNRSINYSVRLYAGYGGGANKWRVLIDVFNIRYPWCWTPIISDAKVSPESEDYNTQFTFTINVTNPIATTNVSLWTRTVGGSWTFVSSRTCTNCSKQNLTFTKTFTSGDIGDQEFKFNATDNQGFSTQAGNPSTLGTRTNECIDSGNDCVFTITNVVVSSGAPTLEYETVNGVTSEATEGWGKPNWVFSVNVSNPAGGAGNISLNLSINTGSGFVKKANSTCFAPCSTPANFTFYLNLSCSDISGTAQYRFTATNLNGTSTTTQSFIIEKDDITFEHVLGNGSIANRSGEQLDGFELRVFDNDNNTYIMNNTNITFSVMRDSSTWGTGVVVATNASGSAIYNFNPTCSPRYDVGLRDWKAETLSSSQCYKATASDTYDVTIIGDITPTLAKPKYHYETGGQNFSQEQTINFLGSSVDDCGTALTLNTTLAAAEVEFYMSGAGDYNCTEGIDLVGSNAYSCDLATSISTNKGWYNASIFTNKSNYYSNLIEKTGDPGEFYIGALKRLASPYVTPNSSGWGVPNWNFSVVASSGDPDETYNVVLYVGTTWPPTTVCNETTSPACYNQTSTECVAPGCTNTLMNWYANFSCANIGTWYYRFGMGNYYEENIKSITITRNDVNITHLSGNGSSASLVNPAILNLTAYDLTKDSSEISNLLYIKFNVTTNGNSFAYAGSNLTNASGNVIFSFLPTIAYSSGVQKWNAYVDTAASTCYNPYLTENFSVTLSTEYNNPPAYYNETINEVTSGLTMGWGQQTNFSISVNDTEGSDINISLQVNTNGTYVQIANATCLSCSAKTQYNFTYDNFACSNINPTSYYKFVITDGESNVETTARLFVIEKDDITFEHVLGDGSIANRSGEQLDGFELRVFDNDNNTYIMNNTNITFSVMRDSSTWGTGVVVATNASGSAIYNFNPTCSPRYDVGLRDWKAETLSSSQCYKATASDTYDVTIIGDITPTLAKPKYHYETGGQNFSQEQTINFLGSSVDDCGTALTLNTTLAAAEVQFYMSGAGDYNCTEGIDLVGSNAYS